MYPVKTAANLMRNREQCKLPPKFPYVFHHREGTDTVSIPYSLSSILREPLTIRIGNSSEPSGRTITKSKDLRKLQQNLFYKQPECFVNDRIQKNNNGNLRFFCRLPRICLPLLLYPVLI